jgi:hypothetical protein
VSLDGDRALIGALGADGVVRESGAAYVWVLTGGSWQLEEKLVAPDGAKHAQFGNAVALHGDRALVGAPGDAQDGQGAGAAYVFVRQAGVWVFEQKLNAAGAAPGAGLGLSVALHDARAVVGAPRAADVGTDSGAVVVFALNAGSWSEEARLSSQAAVAGAAFGESVAFDGVRAVVGAPQCPTCQTAGWASVFRVTGGVWSEEQVLISAGGHDFDRFGDELDIEGETIVVGASLDDQVGDGVGAFVLWRLCDGVWKEVGRGVPEDPFAFDEFAHAVALSGNRIGVGAWRDDDAGSFSGSGYVFQRVDTVEFELYCFGDAGTCPCGNGDTSGGCRTSTGLGGRLDVAAGSASVLADDLVLEAMNLPPNANGLFFMAGGAARVPLGDGNLCVVPSGIGLRRFPLRAADSAGVLREGPGLVAYSRATFPSNDWIRVCARIQFQAWFRDAMGPCGRGSNLSNALLVRFH